MTTIGESTSSLIASGLIIPTGSVLVDSITSTTSGTALTVSSVGSNILSLGATSSGVVTVGNLANITGALTMSGTQIISSARNVTNLTITDASNVVAASSLNTTGSSVAVSGSAPTAAGQQLITTSTGAATWQTLTNYASVPVYPATVGYTYNSTAGVAGGNEYGIQITPSITTQITALRFYHASSGTVATSHTLHLWNSTGTLLATTTTANETSGWNSAPLTSNIILTSGATYTISFTVGTDTVFPVSDQTITFPVNLTQYTEVHGVASTTAGTFPTLILTRPQLIGLDIAIPAQTLQLQQAPASPSLSNSSASGCISGNPRIIFGYVSPTPSTVTLLYGSYGFATFTYVSLGNYNVVLTNPYIFQPAVVLAMSNLFNGSNYIAKITNLSPNGFTILLLIPSSGYVDVPFNIMIIGY